MEHVSINPVVRGPKPKLMTFVVERRPAIPAEALPMLREALTDASRRLTARGQPVRYMGHASAPTESGMRCFFEAVSADAVKTVNKNAQAPFTSIRVVTKDTYLPTR